MLRRVAGQFLGESKFERGEKTPTPKVSALLRKRPVLLRANFVLTKDRKQPYYGHFCGKVHREGFVVKRPGVLSKVQMLDLVLGVGVFSLLPINGGPLSAICTQSSAIVHYYGPLGPFPKGNFCRKTTTFYL